MGSNAVDLFKMADMLQKGQGLESKIVEAEENADSHIMDASFKGPTNGAEAHCNRFWTAHVHLL
jgi:hypothetical protein